LNSVRLVFESVLRSKSLFFRNSGLHRFGPLGRPVALRVGIASGRVVVKGKGPMPTWQLVG